MTSLDKVALGVKARVTRTADVGTVLVGVAVLALAEQRRHISKIIPSFDVVRRRSLLTSVKEKEKKNVNVEVWIDVRFFDRSKVRVAEAA